MSHERITEISPAAVRDKRERGERFLLLDCREPDELEIARLEGAVHIPMGDIPSQLQQLDPDQEIVVFCHHGIRSHKVACFLAQQDFPNVKSMAGGIDAWSMTVDPRVPVY